MIVISALIAGTLDILAAVVLSLLNGGNPLVMLQYIASGVFGGEAFSGGLAYSFAGLLFHYFIAFFWTLLFFVIYPRLPIKNIILVGVFYGILIWLAMNLIVLPIAFAPEYSVDWPSSLTGMAILVAAMGIPLAYMANMFYRRRV